MRTNGNKTTEVGRRDTLVQTILGRFDEENAPIADLLRQAIAEEIYEAFPRDGEGFLTRKSFREHKRTSFDFDALLDILADITFNLQSQAVVDKVGDLIGMGALEPDPHLYAGGFP